MRVVAGKLEVLDLDVGKVRHGGERQVLGEVEVVGWDEPERLGLNLGRLETPRELFLSDEVLGELSEARLVVNVELRLLLDATVSGSDADVV